MHSDEFTDLQRPPLPSGVFRIPVERYGFVADMKIQPRCRVLVCREKRLLDIAALARGAQARLRTADYAPELLALPIASLAN
jgi:hypothetical protein